MDGYDLLDSLRSTRFDTPRNWLLNTVYQEVVSLPFSSKSDELAEMERIVNEKIWEAFPVETIETDIDTAKNMGAMALFGEKYGHDVRVVHKHKYSIISVACCFT